MKKPSKERALYHYAQPALTDEDPSYEPQAVSGAGAQPATWDRTDALLSEVLRVLHLLRGDVQTMLQRGPGIAAGKDLTQHEDNTTASADIKPFPSRALRNGSPI